LTDNYKIVSTLQILRLTCFVVEGLLCLGNRLDFEDHAAVYVGFMRKSLHNSKSVIASWDKKKPSVLVATWAWEAF